MIRRRTAIGRTVRLAAMALAVLATAAADAAAEPAVVDARRAHALAARGALTIVDVRHPSEWRETGVPKGALRGSIHEPGGIDAFLARIDRLTGGDRATPLAVICAGGVRSQRAARHLRAHGYTEVLDIGEGVLGSGHGPGWLARGLPMEPCLDCARD